MGSRSNVEKAYIAGFLDGDGSLMLQVKKRSDTKRGYRFMATICLYQDVRHDKTLHWIRQCLDAGYITTRKDHISELRINGFRTVKRILEELRPYLRFKKLQCEALITACQILIETNIDKLSSQQLFLVIEQVLIIQNENYATHHKRSREQLLKIFDLTP